MAIGVVVLLVVFEVFLAGRRGADTVRESLEANEATLKTFRRLARDVRSAREIFAPGVAPQGSAMPDFSWSAPDAGTHVLDLEVAQLVIHDTKMVPVAQRVRWFLDQPEDVGAGSDATRRFQLFRQHSDYYGPGIDAGATAPLPADKEGPVDTPLLVADGITALVFFRVAADAANPSPDVGPDNVQVLLQSARVRRLSGGREALGYSAELRTSINKRGAIP